MKGDRSWDHHNPTRISFGCGRVRELSTHARGRCLVVTTAGMTRRGLTTRVTDLLGPGGGLVFDRVDPNPQVDAVDKAARELRREGIETVVALGGGSSMDFAKALSVALPCPSLALRSLLEGNQPLGDLERLTVIAVPTTAGTGSEVTPFATLWDQVQHKKYSLSTPTLFPKVALLDPELTLSLPWDDTLASGLDAYSQCFESIWNRNATPVTTALAERGLALVPAALRCLKTDPGSIEARADMLEASLLSGLAISRTRTALAHSISYPITAHHGVPHGLACAFTVPAVLAFNLEHRDPRLADLALRAGLTDAAALVRSIVDLFRELGVADAFRMYVPDYAALYALVPEMLTPGRADNNLRPASLEAVREILRTTEAWLFNT
jgi:alcohol dehydrogenase